MKSAIHLLIVTSLAFTLNCSTEEDKKEKRCQNDRKVLELCLLINQNDSRFCETQSGTVYLNCGTPR